MKNIINLPELGNALIKFLMGEIFYLLVGVIITDMQLYKIDIVDIYYTIFFFKLYIIKISFLLLFYNRHIF